MSKRLVSESGVVCRLPGERLGYFGWPSVARLDDGTLIVGSSGLRTEHVCPFGKTVINVSSDEGRSWSEPRAIQDSLIDDRDVGVVNLGGGKVLVTWFRSQASRQCGEPEWLKPEEVKLWREAHAACDGDELRALLGSWVMLSVDGGVTWGAPMRVPVSAPHGPTVLRSGELLYLGKDFSSDLGQVGGTAIEAARSGDNGSSWEVVGSVPVAEKTVASNYHEPHVVELPSGRLVGMIRIQNYGNDKLADSGIEHFSMMQTESDDGGRTWSRARALGFHGSPPHLLRHSSGVLILTYGYRLAPYGQRVAFSYDDGATWDYDWILRDDGPGSDLGYPATVELTDGELFTVYYQKYGDDTKCSLLSSHWKLPG